MKGCSVRNKNKPEFFLTCRKTGSGLMRGVVYKVLPWNKTGNGVAVHWRNPMSDREDPKYVSIGYHNLDKFNTAPVEEWNNKMKKPERIKRVRPVL